MEAADEAPHFLFQLNEHHHLVDGLAYIDPMAPEDQTEVKALVEAEMKRMPARDYLASLPLPKSRIFDENGGEEEFAWEEVVLRGEMARLKEGVPMPRLDLTKYEAPSKPAGQKAKDAQAWMRALQDAKALAEYNTTAITNLELSVKYAQNMWLKHISELEVHAAGQKRRASALKQRAGEINKYRKIEQVSCANEFRSAATELEEFTERNLELARVLAAAKKDVEAAADALRSD